MTVGFIALRLPTAVLCLLAFGWMVVGWLAGWLVPLVLSALAVGIRLLLLSSFRRCHEFPLFSSCTRIYLSSSFVRNVLERLVIMVGSGSMKIDLHMPILVFCLFPGYIYSLADLFTLPYLTLPVPVCSTVCSLESSSTKTIYTITIHFFLSSTFAKVR